MASRSAVDSNKKESSHTANYIRIANQLLEQLNLSTRVTCLEEVGANCFVPLYEGLCGEELPEIIRNPQSLEDDRHNLQMVIDSLSTDILHVSLSHIRAEDILAGDRQAVCNLLEIFQGLMEFILGQMTLDDANASTVRPLPEKKNLPDKDVGQKHPFSSSPIKNDNGRSNSTRNAGREDRLTNVDLQLGQDTTEEDEQEDNSKEDDEDANDRDYRLLREHINRVSAEAHQVGSLAQELAATCTSKTAAAAQKQEELSDREALLRDRLRCLVEQRDSLTPGVPGDDEQEQEANAASLWWKDYQRFRKQEEVAEILDPARRLQSYAEEHQDRIASVRHPPGRRRVIPLASASSKPGDEVQVGSARRELLRQMYDQQLREIDTDERLGLAARTMALESVKENLSLEEKKEVKWSARGPRSRLQRKLEAMANGDRRAAAQSGFIKGGKNGRASSLSHSSRSSQHHRLPLSHSVQVNDEDDRNALLADLLERFPYLDLSRETINELRHLEDKRASHHNVHAATNPSFSKVQVKVSEAEQRQRLLAQILRKELEANARLREKKERRAQEYAVRALERERKQISARSRQYYDEFAVRQRAKQMQKRSREEQVFRQLFKESLQVQRARLRELRQCAKEFRERRCEKELNELQSLENFYRDRFDLLAEDLHRERHQLEQRERGERHATTTQQRELRRSLEHQVRQLQKDALDQENEVFYRRLDAERALLDVNRRFSQATK